MPYCLNEKRFSFSQYTHQSFTGYFARAFICREQETIVIFVACNNIGE